MKRFVSYLYSIYNNQKIHNAGFARIELRTGRNRIEIHLKDIGYAGKTGTVYLFVRNEKNIQGVSIGNITFRGNQADLRYEQVDEIIGQTSWTIMQMNGIIVTIDKKVAFLSQWDEIPVDTEKFEVWEQTEKAQGDINESGNEQNDLNKTKEKMTEDSQDKNNQENENSDTNNKKTEQITRNIHETRVGRNNQRQHMNQVTGTTPRQNSNRNQTGLNPDQNQSSQEKMDQGQGQSSHERNRSDQGSRNEIKQDVQVSQEKTNQSQSSQNQMNQGQMSQKGNNPGKGISQVNRTNPEQGLDQAKREEESQKILSEQSKPTPAIRTAEIQPQLQSGSQGWEQTWRYMLRVFPVIKQFDNKDDVLCIRIEIKDVRLLPDKYWSIVNNSFLLHGFFNYRYLAFGRIGQNWFIGVPGIYQNQEHAMASIFGFPDFLAQQHKNERGEQPGYWYRILELNQP